MMFKVGDKVRCIQKSFVRSNNEGHYGKVGDIYTVVKDSLHRSIYLTGNGIREHGLIAERFELVQETPMISTNPAIEEYTKTVTVRKLRPVSVITINHERNRIKGIKQRNEIIVEAGYKGVLLKTRGHQSYECFVDADELRTLAKQLIEIADVLDETTKD